jgi:hypothetical protein
MIPTKIRLTGRQYALRRLLMERSGEWLTAKQIFSLMNFSLISEDRYEWDGRANFTGTVGREIVADVEAINASGAFDKIVVSDRSKGYKLATKEEYERYSKSRWKSLKRSIKGLSQLDWQARLDRQTVIRFDAVPYGEDVHDCFVGEARR